MGLDSFFSHPISALYVSAEPLPQDPGLRCVTSQEMLFHLSQVPAIWHSQLKLKGEDQGLKGFF